jgi:transcription antitermination factor NusG
VEQWYVLYSKPHKEFRLRDALTQKGVQAYVPTCPPKGRQKSPQPLFFRYLFARLDLEQATPQIVRWLPGLTCFVQFGDTYAVVPDQVITYIQQRAAAMGQREAAPFRPGQRVRIVGNHPLAQLDAVFERDLSSSARAHILVETLGRLVRCEVELEALEAIEEGQGTA